VRLFYGLDTKYLDNDLGWFRAFDSHAHRRTLSAAFLALAIGA
jgi:hypothetical protein